MPFHSVQGVLRRVLPEKTFEGLYKVACNWFDVYQLVLDKIYYAYPSKDWDEWVKRRFIGLISPYTMTSRIGLIATYETVKEVVKNQIEGSFVECGVARGGCAALMAIIARNEEKGRRTWLFDSFEGLPRQSDKDGVQKQVRHKGREANDLAEGYCLGTFDKVSSLLYKKLGLDPLKVIMVKGWFQDSLPMVRVGKIAVLRLDGDWYESTKCCLENLYDNVVTGGYLIIDDYQLQGCRFAVDEFQSSRGFKAYMTFDANGRAYWRK